MKKFVFCISLLLAIASMVAMEKKYEEEEVVIELQPMKKNGKIKKVKTTEETKKVESVAIQNNAQVGIEKTNEGFEKAMETLGWTMPEEDKKDINKLADIVSELINMQIAKKSDSFPKPMLNVMKAIALNSQVKGIRVREDTLVASVKKMNELIPVVQQVDQLYELICEKNKCFNVFICVLINSVCDNIAWVNCYTIDSVTDPASRWPGLPMFLKKYIYGKGEDAFFKNKDTLCMVLKGHTNKIQCFYANNNKEIAVSGAGDNTVRVWDLESGKCKHILDVVSPSSLDLDVDGKHFAIANRSSIVSIHDVDTGQLIDSLKHDETEKIECLAYVKGCDGSDKSMLITVPSKSLKFYIWDLRSKEKSLFSLAMYKMWCNDYHHTRNGKTVKKDGNDLCVYVCDRSMTLCKEALKRKCENKTEALSALLASKTAKEFNKIEREKLIELAQ